MSEELRNAYRVNVEGAGIHAEISGQNGRAVGDALDLSLLGATIRIPLDQSPHCFVGETVTVKLESKQMKLVDIVATVQVRAERAGFVRFGLAFTNPAALHARLRTALLRFFNERGAFRVEPREALPVRVQTHDQSLVTTGHLSDISVDGAGIVIKGISEQALSKVIEVTVEFTLPGQDHSIALQASIRHRSIVPVDDSVYVGLLFDAEASPDFIDQQRDITAYVASLQGDLLRQLAEA